ncbi:hypothetical protein CEW83_03070 [Parazoarcus communis]|uniref:Phage tail protein n=1 Tax=Parazoarcus communis TaxID=41977 RepID=A0A2U8GVM1_9RHOO|nr:hypothetical protein [Parazoarcus communis]AWI77464.1 hypothetical protein CEW83_03070 [Parazoarcus communis]
MLKGIQLTLLVGPGVPVPAPKPVMDALESVEVTSAAGSPSGFQLAFAIDSRSPLHTLLLIAGGQVPWLRVILVATLNSLPTVLMDGLITRQEISGGNEPGQGRLTITGEDLTVAMDKQDMSGLPYPAMPPAARVALIVARYGLYGMLPVIIPSVFEDVPIPVDRIPTHEGTDLAYTRQLARDAGHVFYIEPGPLPGANIAYWGPEIRLGPVQPALNTGMDVHTNVESLSFAVNQSDAEMPIVFIQNPITKFPIPLPVPDVSLANPPLGLIPPMVKSLKLMKETAKLSPIAALGKGLAAAAASSADAVTGNGSLDVLRYGHILKARQLVGVRGAGMAFDGLYYVKRVSSSLKAGEFRQSFSLARNGLVSTLPLVPA